MDLADDSAAGIEHAGDYRCIRIGRVTLERRGAIHHRHAREAYIVLQRDLLAGELSARRAPDLRLDVPGVVLVLLTFGTIAGRARIFDGWHVIRHGIDRFVSDIIRLQQRVIGFQFRFAHMHTEVLGYAAQLIESGSSDSHGLVSLWSP